ncbi:MAG: hypothetical protein ABL921_09315 [Pirellula sp.]
MRIHERNTRIASLIAVLAATSFVWVIVLPRIGDVPSVRRRIDLYREAGINPTAVFYTDHPGMTNIERSVAANVDDPSGSFWKPSFDR